MTEYRISVDYDFYRNRYGGQMPDGAFAQSVGRASETILALLTPRLPSDLTETELYRVKLAVCAQAESGLDRPAAAEQTGEFRTTYADGILRIQGIPVSTGAAAYLRQAGLMEGWL